MTASISQAFAFVVGVEGGLSLDSSDAGNWTGGAVNKGVLRGTKYGISAAAYPDLDISALTVEHAQELFKADYWDKVRGDNLPPSLALVVVDSAYNNGPVRAARFLQQAVGVAQDGIIGPTTLAAVAKHQTGALIVELLARRMVFQMTLPTVGTFGLGWARRLAGLPFAAMAMEGAAQPALPPEPVPAAPAAPVVLGPDVQEAIEVAVRKQLEDQSYQTAVAQRVGATP